MYKIRKLIPLFFPNQIHQKSAQKDVLKKRSQKECHSRFDVERMLIPRQTSFGENLVILASMTLRIILSSVLSEELILVCTVVLPKMTLAKVKKWKLQQMSNVSSLSSNYQKYYFLFGKNILFLNVSNPLTNVLKHNQVNSTKLEVNPFPNQTLTEYFLNSNILSLLCVYNSGKEKLS